MQNRSLFKRLGPQSLSVRLSFPGVASATWKASFKNADRLAAWELYIEMATTVFTQSIGANDGDEEAALNSLHSMFSTTREVLRRYGPPAYECSRVAIAMLNKAVRPFTTKWHQETLAQAFKDDLKRQEFRTELSELQRHLGNYIEQLRKIADVPSITNSWNYQED